MIEWVTIKINSKKQLLNAVLHSILNILNLQQRLYKVKSFSELFSNILSK